MPEGPEVYNTALFWNAHLQDREFLNLIEVKSGKLVNKGGIQLSGCIYSVRARSKRLIFSIGSNYLVSFFALEGHWSFEPTKHNHLILEYTDGFEIKKIYYNDSRVGKNFVFSQGELDMYLRGYGPDWVYEEVTFDHFKKNLKRKINLPKFLLNPQISSGIGNYLCSEILHHARLYPGRICNTLTPEESKRLYESCKKLVKQAVEQKGATLYTFFYPDGSPGTFECKVYHRKFDERGRIVKHKDFGNKRSTYYVPEVVCPEEVI